MNWGNIGITVGIIGMSVVLWIAAKIRHSRRHPSAFSGRFYRPRR